MTQKNTWNLNDTHFTMTFCTRISINRAEDFEHPDQAALTVILPTSPAPLDFIPKPKTDTVL